jgi:serine/threonine protein phosphatase PrpC
LLSCCGLSPVHLFPIEYYAHWRHQRQVHAHLLRGAHAFPGTTAVVALLAPAEPAPGAPRRLYVANSGDCRAVLVRSRRPLAASRDHTGLLEDERARLAAAGLQVTWQHGGWRIGSTGLQVTRCIGDFDVKGVVGPDGHSKPGQEAAAALGSGVGVTAVPEVTAVDLQPGPDHFLILGSDGLWDVMSVQEAAGLVYDTVKDPVMAAKRLVCEVRSLRVPISLLRMHRPRRASRLAECCACACAPAIPAGDVALRFPLALISSCARRARAQPHTRLFRQALMRGSADNVTAVVVFMTPVETLERVFGLEEGESFAVTGTAYGSRVRMDKDRHLAATADEIRDTY